MGDRTIFGGGAGGGASPELVLAKLSVEFFEVASGSTHQVVFQDQVDDIDTLDAFDIGTPDRFVVTEAGLYLVSVVTAWDFPTGVGTRRVHFGGISGPSPRLSDHETIAPGSAVDLFSNMDLFGQILLHSNEVPWTWGVTLLQDSGDPVNVNSVTVSVVKV